MACQATLPNYMTSSLSFSLGIVERDQRIRRERVKIATREEGDKRSCILFVVAVETLALAIRQNPEIQYVAQYPDTSV